MCYSFKKNGTRIRTCVIFVFLETLIYWKGEYDTKGGAFMIRTIKKNNSRTISSDGFSHSFCECCRCRVWSTRWSRVYGHQAKNVYRRIYGNLQYKNNSRRPVYRRYAWIKQGSTVIASWSDAANHEVTLSGTATVTSGVTYTLTVYGTIDGVAFTPASITKTP